MIALVGTGHSHKVYYFPVWSGFEQKVVIHFRIGVPKPCPAGLLLGVQLKNLKFTLFIVPEMAEHHNAKAVLKIGRELVHRVQSLIENK